MDDSEDCSYGRLVIDSFIVTTSLMHYVLCRVYGKISNHPDDSAPTTAQIWRPVISGFPLLKSPLKGKKLQTIDEIQEKTMGAADGDWENCVRSQGAYFGGD